MMSARFFVFGIEDDATPERAIAHANIAPEPGQLAAAVLPGPRVPSEKYFATGNSEPEISDPGSGFHTAL